MIIPVKQQLNTKEKAIIYHIYHMHSMLINMSYLLFLGLPHNLYVHELNSLMNTTKNAITVLTIYLAYIPTHVSRTLFMVKGITKVDNAELQ